MTSRLLIALLVAAAVAGPAVGQPFRGCRSDDLVCRVDMLERRVGDLERRLSEMPASGPPAPPPRASVDVPVDTWCTWESCTAIAVRLCKESGFTRGVPKSVDNNKLVVMTCMD